MLYNTLVLPLFDYGNIIYRTTDQTYLKQLQILQNNGAKCFLIVTVGLILEIYANQA